MSSYAYEVKNELARIFDDEIENLRAELAALLQIGAVEVDGRVDFANSNAAVSRKVFKLVKKIFPDARTEVATVRTKKLRKTVRYFVRIFFTGQTQNFLSAINSAELTRHQTQRIAYLRGAFLASGTINRPEAKRYHLEISSASESLAQFVRKNLKRLNFPAAIYERKENFVVYFDESDLILDFLAMVGAEKAVERFEVARNIKEVRAQINRIVNCETANLNRAVDAAQRQLADIRLLMANHTKVGKTVQEVMKMRLKNPESSVSELAEKLFISRPGVMYHFRMIHKMAEEIRSHLSS